MAVFHDLQHESEEGNSSVIHNQEHQILLQNLNEIQHVRSRTLQHNMLYKNLHELKRFLIYVTYGLKFLKKNSR